MRKVGWYFYFSRWIWCLVIFVIGVKIDELEDGGGRSFCLVLNVVWEELDIYFRFFGFFFSCLYLFVFCFLNMVLCFDLTFFSDFTFVFFVMIGVFVVLFCGLYFFIRCVELFVFIVWCFVNIGCFIGIWRLVDLWVGKYLMVFFWKGLIWKWGRICIFFW